MASLVLSGDTSGSVTLAAPAVAGSTTQTLVAETGTLAPVVSGTAQASTSGTSIDFTGIHSWVKRITVMFNGVSTNGASAYLVQLGDAGGVENTGYASYATRTAVSALVSAGSTAGFNTPSNDATSVYSGSYSIFNISGNIWVASWTLGSNASSDAVFGGGNKTLSDTLTQVRITTVNGTDTFDAGSINILYE